MSRFDDEPLSPEERALAERLGRLGPHDGPSPSLDAKILAAAHAAVAPKQRRRRWLGLTAVPGSLITGAGMAAALVLVIGTVWQLRPADPAPRAAREEGEGVYVSAELIKREQKVVAPPPPPMDTAAPARALNAPAVATAPAAAQRKAAPMAQAAAPAPEQEEAPAAVARMATVGPDEPIALRNAPAASRGADPFTAPAAAPAAPREMQAYSEAEKTEEFELARARQQRSDEDSAAARRGLVDTASVAAPAAAVAAVPVPAPAPVPAESGSNTTLDRIEVTGSRIRSADLLATTPVTEDARLEPAAWLERIRARRDAGDPDGARDSLVLFRKAHPRVSLPRDLRALAKPAIDR